MVARLLRPLFSTKEATWVGHALQGFVFAFALTYFNIFVAEAFVLGAFVHREASDLITPVAKGELTWGESLKRLNRDGLPDLFSAIIGAHAGIAANLIFF